MQYFHFERLIDKYSRKFKALLPSKGGYDESGEYVKGQAEEVELYGAILNINERKIYNSNGTLTTLDRQLYVKGRLTADIIGAQIIFEDKQYSVEEETENREFTGFSAYILRFVSAFNKEGAND